jgi:ribosome-binding protein aMBF1 (putative translation factor)
MATILPNQGITMEFANVRSAHTNTQDSATHLHGFDGGALSPPATRENTDRADALSMTAGERLHRGHVMLDSALIRQLRQTKCMSQQDLADDCWRRNIQLSLTTIKRAEAGRAVRFRIAREFARCFDVLVAQIVRAEEPAVECNH